MRAKGRKWRRGLRRGPSNISGKYQCPLELEVQFVSTPKVSTISTLICYAVMQVVIDMAETEHLVC